MKYTWSVTCHIVNRCVVTGVSSRRCCHVCCVTAIDVGMLVVGVIQYVMNDGSTGIMWCVLLAFIH